MGCSCEGKSMRTEVWNCGAEGPIDVPVDAAGCPTVERFCKLQAGATALAVAAGAAIAATITVVNLVAARIRGLVMEASDPAAPIATSLGGSLLAQIGITGITVLGTNMLSGECPATRWAYDATGPGGVGTMAQYKGDLGTAGGTVVFAGINRSASALNFWACVDIDGVKAN